MAVVSVLGLLATAGAWAGVLMLGDGRGGDSAFLGNWGSPTRGQEVSIRGGNIDTAEEQAEHAKRGAAGELREELGELRRKVLGDQRKMRGDRVRGRLALPPGVGNQNPKEACRAMQLGDPDRFGGLDCEGEDDAKP